MPITNLTQGHPATLPVGNSQPRPAQADSRQDGVAFDLHFLKAQASPIVETSEASTPEPIEDPFAQAAAEQGVSPEEALAEEGEEEADEEAASAVVTLLMPTTTVWTAPEAEEPAAPVVQAVAEPIREAAPMMAEPMQDALQTQPEAAPETPAAAEGVNILERPAEASAETNPGPADASAPVTAQGIMDDPVAEAMPPAEEASARMPTETPIVSWEVERQDASGDPSSLENVDTEAPPPPSRVEVTHVVQRQDGTQDAQSENLSNEREIPEALPMQEARAAAFEPAAQAPDEATPAAQIVEETQIQQAMGRAQFTMRLQPETLGEVTVRLTLTAEGLTARIITQSEGARQAIVNEIAVLGDSMRERGIDVRSVEVLDGSMGHASLLHDGGRQGRQDQDGQKGGARVVIGRPAGIVDGLAEQDLYSVDGLEDTAGIEVRA